MQNMVSRSSSSWSQLPNSMFELICSRLSLGDILKVAEVCKDWRSMTGDLNLPPCLLYRKCQPRGHKKTFFFDPLSKTDKELREDQLDFMDHTSVLQSKNGWVLLRKIFGDKNKKFMFFFFLNPLTKRRIDLPVFDKHVGIPFSFSYSSAPTSKDCIVFGIIDVVADGSKLLILTCRRGEHKWEDIVVENNVPNAFVGPLLETVHHNGCFYTVNLRGEIGIFKVGSSGSEHTWTVLSKPQVLEPFPIDVHNPSFYRFKVLSFVTSKEDDELLLMLDLLESLHVFKLIDPWKNEWKEVQKIGGSIYCCRYGLSLTKEDRTNPSDNVYFDKLIGGFFRYGRPVVFPKRMPFWGGLWIEFDFFCPPEEQLSW